MEGGEGGGELMEGRECWGWGMSLCMCGEAGLLLFCVGVPLSSCINSLSRVASSLHVTSLSHVTSSLRVASSLHVTSPSRVTSRVTCLRVLL